MYKIFKKAGKPGWIAFIPFYNTYTFFEITWEKGWVGVVMTIAPLLIPEDLHAIKDIFSIIEFVIYITTILKLAKVFGKSTGFTVGLLFLPLIFIPILAFDSSKYIYNMDIPENMPSQNNISSQTFNN